MATVELPYLDVYKWSHNLSAEMMMPTEDEYLMSKPVRSLIRRLTQTTNNMIAVIGNQGSGKSAALQIISWKLNDAGKNVVTLKWRGFDALFDRIVYGVGRESAKYYRDLLNEKRRSRAAEAGNINLADRINRGLEDKFNATEVEGRINKTELQKMRFEAMVHSAGNPGIAATFLIDFPDYDRKSHGKMLNDLERLIEWWEAVVAYSRENDEESTNVNIVIFFQKELWGGHFLFGKFDTVELGAFDAERLCRLYEIKFGGPAPFNWESLRLIGVFARGVVRWFKKYIRICLDEFYDESESGPNISEITASRVRQWVPISKLAEDWERELIAVFPRDRGPRLKAVAVLTYIHEVKRTPQKDIMIRFFEDSGAGRTACSRLLTALETHGYLTRNYDGKEKIVAVAEPS